MNSPVAIESRHGMLTRRKLNEHRAGLIEGLATGAPSDYPAYMQLVGRIHGIDEALKISDAADFELNGGEG